MENIYEKPIMELHPHFLSFFGSYLMGSILVISGLASFVFSLFVLGAIAILVGVITFLLTEISRRAETFYVLDNGVAKEYKMFSTSRKFVEYEKIQDVEISQSFLQKIFGIGHIDFDTASVEKVIVDFKNVRDPYRIEKIVRDKMKKE